MAEEITIVIKLSRKGGGPQRSDRLSEVIIDGRHKAHYADPDEVQALVATEIENAIETLRG